MPGALLNFPGQFQLDISVSCTQSVLLVLPASCDEQPRAMAIACAVAGRLTLGPPWPTPDIDNFHVIIYVFWGKCCSPLRDTSFKLSFPLSDIYSFFNTYFYLFVWVVCLHVCRYITCMQCPETRRRESDQLLTDTVVSCLVGAETEAGSSAVPLTTESSLQSLDAHFKLAHPLSSLFLPITWNPA